MAFFIEIRSFLFEVWRTFSISKWHVFLEQKANDKTENTTNSILFAIEVIQIKNIEIDYTNVRDESNNYDWTISCAYDQKVIYFKMIIF